MKKILFFLIIAASFFMITAASNGIERASAIVNQYEGLYVFTDSKPNNDYQYLGTVKPTGRLVAAMGGTSNQYTDVRGRLVAAAKKRYPGAEAIILTLIDGEVDKADVIKFK